MYTADEIRQVVEIAVKEVTGKPFNTDKSLIDRDSGIMPANFLYIFEILEEKLNLPVCSIFETNSYEVMTIDNLSKAIFTLQTP